MPVCRGLSDVGSCLLTRASEPERREAGGELTHSGWYRLFSTGSSSNEYSENRSPSNLMMRSATLSIGMPVTLILTNLRFLNISCHKKQATYFLCYSDSAAMQPLQPTHIVDVLPFYVLHSPHAEC